MKVGQVDKVICFLDLEDKFHNLSNVESFAKLNLQTDYKRLLVTLAHYDLSDITTT